jgi:RimJ/RimL family protein N-acetyltransferase
VCYQEHNQAAQRLAERVGFRGHTSNALTGVVARLDRQQWRAGPLIKKGH